eukprot:8015984-Heterocapsa_arctica.AAC.1
MIKLSVHFLSISSKTQITVKHPALKLVIPSFLSVLLHEHTPLVSLKLFSNVIHLPLKPQDPNDLPVRVPYPSGEAQFPAEGPHSIGSTEVRRSWL